MPKIFLSHSVRDDLLVKEFTKLLVLGMNFSFDDIYCTSNNVIPTGAQYIDDIKDNLIRAQVVVLLLSSNYFNSPFCLCEMGAAWVQNKTVIPILVPPKTFKDIEYPSTPLKVTQARKIDNKQDIIKIFDELVNSGTTKNASHQRFSEELENFFRKKPWISGGLIKGSLQRPAISSAPLLPIPASTTLPTSAPVEKPYNADMSVLISELERVKREDNLKKLRDAIPKPPTY